MNIIGIFAVDTCFIPSCKHKINIKKLVQYLLDRRILSYRHSRVALSTIRIEHTKVYLQRINSYKAVNSS